MRRQSSWIRYGLARLRPLGRPVFWGPLIALLFLVLFAWEFFSRPELATYLGIPDSNETLSAEDQAIGADIDSISLLMNDIQVTSRSQTSQTPVRPTTQANPTAPTPTPTNRLFSTPPESVTPPQSAQTPSGQGVFGAFTNALSTRLGLPSTVQADSTIPAPLPANRLQEAIDKLATENRPVAQAPIEGTIRLDNPINAAPTNSFSALVEGVQPIAPGTAPVISAPLPIAPPINTSVPTIAPQPNQPSDFGVIQQPAPVVNQQPFTVPRPIPGRAIGGGNFNTFSNP
ncbi:hypothetical protein LEP3755_38940 [Leptolyngbya sp. NIES-3755]|nr:hypothetical protein LEP3755_38940 [Leptolyngbya sp. NIES-3755]